MALRAGNRKLFDALLFLQKQEQTLKDIVPETKNISMA